MATKTPFPKGDVGMVVMTSGNYFSGLYQDDDMDSIRNSSFTETVIRTKKMTKQKIKYTF